MKFFYCQSYQAFLLALYYREQKIDIKIITAHSDIIKACDFLKIPYLRIPHFRLKELIFKSKKVKNSIETVSLEIGDKSLSFTHRQFAYYCFFLVNKQLRKGKDVYFYDFETIYNEKASIKKFGLKFFNTSFSRILISFIYKVQLKTVSYGKTITNAISDKVFTNPRYGNLHFIDLTNNYYDFIFHLSKNFNLPVAKYQNIYIDQLFSPDSFVDLDKLNFIRRELIGMNITMKFHPENMSSATINSQNTIPEFIPAELVINNVEKSIISIYSAVFFSASKIPGLRIFSILPLVKKSGYDIIKYKEMLLEKTSNKIEFISELDDLRLKLKANGN